MTESWYSDPRLISLKGHRQLWDRADLDTSFVSFEKRFPQPEIKGTRRKHLEIRFNLVQCVTRFSIFYKKPVSENAITHSIILFYHI